MSSRSNLLRGIALFAATLCPVIMLMGYLFISIMLSQPGSGAGEVIEALAVTGISFAAAIGGFAPVMIAFPNRRSRFLGAKEWAFPVACAAAITTLLISGAVELTTDVVEPYVWGRGGKWLFPCSVAFWTLMGSLGVVGLERACTYRPRRTA